MTHEDKSLKRQNMYKILLITSAKELFSEFAAVLTEKEDVDLIWATTGQKALKAISDAPVDLAVVNETLDDMTGIEFMKNLIQINPMINCAAVSPLSPEEFHEVSEGLGVLVKLPLPPGKLDAENLIRHLSKLQNLLKPKT
jgi:response regulator RpfG family c-di-GMP phosphodiesterase